MPRRWFRTKALWLGLPGLIFLVWAWADSSRYETRFSYGRSYWFAYGAHLDGYLLVAFSRESASSAPHHYGSREPLVPKREEAFPGIGIWPQHRHHVIGPDSSGSFVITTTSEQDQLILPHWLLLGLYLIPWGGLVCWRCRKAGAAKSVSP